MALPFASSYIKTTSTTVTRSADNLSIDTANIPAQTLDSSVSADIDLLGLSGLGQLVFNVQGRNFVNLKAIGINPGDKVQKVINGSSSDVSGSVDTPLTKTNHTETFMASSITTTIYLDGVENGSGTHPGLAVGAGTLINIGNEALIRYLFGHIKNFRIFDVALTPEQVANL